MLPFAGVSPLAGEVNLGERRTRCRQHEGDNDAGEDDFLAVPETDGAAVSLLEQVVVMRLRRT